MNLTEQLIHYGQSDYYPFHMPGHKRNHSLGSLDMFSMDITEIDGFDNLHHAEGILKYSMERTAVLYHADQSYFLVNGSTCGILSAISAVTNPGDTILIARNSHKSAYHAAYLRQLHLIYLYPEEISQCEINGGISPEKLESLLQVNPAVKAVLITSPTYEGIVSDIAALSRIAHSHGIPLIVDEAHGAHFGLSKEFPASSVTRGADLVIQSLHKTLPALTQTALLHLNGTLVDKNRVEKFLRIYQTSSPSYLLMASMDSCITLLEEKGELLMESFAERLSNFRQQLSTCHFISLLSFHTSISNAIYDVDKSKLLLNCKNQLLSGKALYHLLREKYHLQCEMCMGSYTLAMTSLMDTADGFSRLLHALQEIDSTLGTSSKPLDTAICASPQVPLKSIYTIAEIESIPVCKIALERAENCIAAEYVYLYPPGIPLIVPGEEISREMIHTLQLYIKSEFEILGLEQNQIAVLTDTCI